MKKTLRTWMLLILVLAMVFSMVACGDTAAEETAEETAAEEVKEEAKTEEPAAEEAEEAEDGEKLLSVNPSGIVVTNSTKTGAAKAAVQKITYNNIENSSFDPIRNENTDELTSHMFEGLYTFCQGEVVLGQAKEVTQSEDGLTWTFTLRDDIYWSDGEPVTSYDFYYAWMRELAPETAAKYVYNLTNVIVGAKEYNAGEGSAEDVGLSCPDDKTFVVQLKAMVLSFDEQLAGKVWMPVRQDTIEANGEAWSLSPETCICNGAFMMKEYVPNEKIVYVKNPYYYDKDNVILEELECHFMTDSSVELMAYETGEIQIAMRTTGDNCLNHLDESYILQRLSSMWLVVNNEDEVLGDARVRKALAMAIDRDALSVGVFKGAEQPAYSIVPNAMKDPSTGELWSDYGQYFEFDPEGAAELLAEAGYPNGEGFPTITYGTSSGTEHESVAQAIVAMWKAYLGINAEIQVEDTASFIAHRKEAGYFDVARYTNSGGYSDPTLNLSYYESTQANNDSQYNNPEYDALLTDLLADNDVASRCQKLHQLEQMLIDDMGVIPLYNPTQKVLIKPEIVGVGMSPAGSLDFKRAYVAE